MTTFPRNSVLFFEIFFSKIFRKKHKVLRKRHLLLNNGVTQWWHFWGSLHFFFKIFFSKIFWKKRSVPRKRHLYFWIMVLPNADVFRELCAFFSEIFFSEISKCRDRALKSVNFCSNQVRAKTCFLLSTNSSRITFVLTQSCTMQRELPFPPIAPRIDKHQRTVLCSAVWQVETSLNAEASGLRPGPWKKNRGLIHYTYEM